MKVSKLLMTVAGVIVIYFNLSPASAMLKLTEKTPMSELLNADEVKVYFYDGESDLKLIKELDGKNQLRLSNLKTLELDIGSCLDYGPDREMINKNFDLLIKFIKENSQLEIVRLGWVRSSALRPHQKKILAPLLRDPTTLAIQAGSNPSYETLSSILHLQVWSVRGDELAALQSIQDSQGSLALPKLKTIEITIGTNLEPAFDTEDLVDLKLIKNLVLDNPQVEKVSVKILDNSVYSKPQLNQIKGLKRDRNDLPVLIQNAEFSSVN
jgi:hypothetical protein